MQLPTFKLPTTQELFAEGLQRFIKERFPNLGASSRTLGAARRYGILYEGQAIAEIESLPINNESLEIRVASLHHRWGKLDGDQVVQPTPNFCGAFYVWVQERYGLELPSPDPRFQDMAGYASFLEFSQGMLDFEELHFEDSATESLRQAIVDDNERGLIPSPNETSMELNLTKMPNKAINDLEGQSRSNRNPWPDCRWTVDDWCNSELYEEYVEAVRTVVRGFDASMRVSYHNDNSEHRDYSGMDVW